MSRRGYVLDAGEFVWLEFNPQAGHEQEGYRPALVVSPRSYNGKTGLMVCCPITTRIKGHPFEVPATVDGLECAILSDRVRSLDWQGLRARRRPSLARPRLVARPVWLATMIPAPCPTRPAAAQSSQSSPRASPGAWLPSAPPAAVRARCAAGA